METLQQILLLGLFLAVLTMVEVQANLSTATYFNWAPQRGKITGPDALELHLNKFGGSGIKSKASFLYGKIELKIKLVPENSAGTVTTFYLSSDGDKHDEVDFEFLGNSTGDPYTIHTNIFTQGFGKREQQFKVWFNPTSDYHTYTIFWNPYAVVCKYVMNPIDLVDHSIYKWLVDDTPIRVFRNYHDKEINFPDSQGMNMFSSLWDAENWATQGGKVKTDWSLAPFKASFKDLKTDACYWQGTQSISKCANPKNPNNWWASPSFFKLTPTQLENMNGIRSKYMFYDYCKDNKRFNGKFPKECSLPQF